MEESVLKSLAAQLRKPQGDGGLEIAVRMNQGNAFMNRFAISQLKLQENMEMLEIGPGNAFFANELLQAHPTLKYQAVDYSELMIAEAQNTLAAFTAEGRTAFHRAEVHQLPLSDEQFDRILGVNIIYFWDDPARELRELGRVLKKDGRIVLGARSMETMKMLPVTQYNFNLYSREDITGFISRAGLNLLEFATTPEQITHLEGKVLDTETWAIVIGK